MTCFIAIFTLLQWSGTKPTVSSRSTCTSRATAKIPTTRPWNNREDQQTQYLLFKINQTGTSLAVQWLRFYALSAGVPGSIPGQGARSHIAQRRAHMPQLKILQAATKILCAATAGLGRSPGEEGRLGLILAAAIFGSSFH